MNFNLRYYLLLSIFFILSTWTLDNSYGRPNHLPNNNQNLKNDEPNHVYPKPTSVDEPSKEPSKEGNYEKPNPGEGGNEPPKEGNYEKPNPGGEGGNDKKPNPGGEGGNDKKPNPYEGGNEPSKEGNFEKPKPNEEGNFEKPKPNEEGNYEKPKPNEEGNDKKPNPDEGGNEPSKEGYYERPPPQNDGNSKKQFDGICYSMLRQEGCKSQDEVKQDLKLLNDYTEHLRLYGNDCEQLSIILDLIDKNQLNLKVLAGVWTRDGPQRRDKEVKAAIDALKKKHHAKFITGITVGNEELFNSRSEDDIIKDMDQVRSMLKKESLEVPVSAVEVGHLWTKKLASNSHTVYANIYSFFSENHEPNQSMNLAAKIIFDKVKELKHKLSNSNQNIIISETGWPSEGDSDGPSYSRPTSSSQSQFLSSLICLARTNHISYYVMEAFDADWKKGPSIEKHFGIFDNDGTLKDSQLISSIKC